ncbi:hypothetical protein OHA72_40585 [Dactylosporangium sp. NBC_01737]|uniref:hypothetical protein n=1 Tax=Dactylosporangium sp. NBC_01737 TaxID=2975959 RepID=UPI002E113F71|nr:hypothetical protein OHA72_40585 [Dactylosporangium sp. NBC_01737]
MRHVVASSFDASAYLGALPQFAGQLPTGAARFATDPGHYDLAGSRCVKDLAVSELLHDGPAGTVRIRYAGNPWKHDEDLIVQYTGVTRLDVDAGDPSEGSGKVYGPGLIGHIMLDEILPAPEGCRHEIAGHRGRVVVVCADLTATWVRVPRPDDPPPGSWTPVLALGDRWHWLGRTPDGTWVVGVPHRRADPAEDSLDTLLEVLAGSWPATARRWSGLPPQAPALQTIVRHALVCGDWRARLALEWLEQGLPMSEDLAGALQVVQDDRRYGQRERHRARRLWKSYRRDAGH